MTGRGVDQVLPHSCPPHLHERYTTSALDYVALAERQNGPIPRPVNFSYVWGEALEVLAELKPDARIINLETSVTLSEAAELKGINYRMHPLNAPVVAAAGIDCCVLANNHVLDWGEAGLLETLAVLKEAGIRVAGAGEDRDAAEAPAVIDLDKGRVLVFAFGAQDSGIPSTWAAGTRQPGVNLLEDFSDAAADAIAEAVRNIKRRGDLALASIHWGGNWGFEIPDAHRRFAHALIERAAIDAVHGHSSHHPKAIELYRGRPIFYGCGDFLDDYEGIRGYEQYHDDLVLMYFATFDMSTGHMRRLEMTPLQIRNFRLQRAPVYGRTWLRDTLDRECQRFGHHVTLREDVLVLE
jgi:poly-gamma-glutamate synthesis protein (capsule biosynthesis protein)